MILALPWAPSPTVFLTTCGGAAQPLLVLLPAMGGVPDLRLDAEEFGACGLPYASGPPSSPVAPPPPGLGDGFWMETAMLLGIWQTRGPSR